MAQPPNFQKTGLLLLMSIEHALTHATQVIWAMLIDLGFNGSSWIKKNRLHFASISMLELLGEESLGTEIYCCSGIKDGSEVDVAGNDYDDVFHHYLPTAF